MPKDPLKSETPLQAMDRIEAGMSLFGFCLLASLPAFFLTSAAMVGGAAPGAGPVRLRRYHWRPRVSIVGMASGVVGGLAAVVLLQQTGRLFPSYEILGRALVAGLLAGIVIPSLTRVIAVRRANRRVAAREAAINAALRRQAEALAAATAPASSGPAATPAPWVATHRVATAAPLRSDPSEAAGQTTELGAGTAVRILEERGTWARVQSANGADGWVEGAHLERMT